jgi:tetratricopeptide (TPR) repeat protein
MTKATVGRLMMALSTAAIFPAILAAQDGIATRVANAMGSRNVPPDCKLDGAGDFRVSSAKVYLRTGIEGSGDASNRTNALKNGDRVLTEAIIKNGQAKNPAAWYYLGRINLQQGDLVGADTTLTKAEQMAPACKADIGMYRYRAYAALVTGGQELKKAGQEDSSVVLYRAANQIMPSLPMAHILLAETFTDRKQSDSAMVYFGRAAETKPTEPTQVKIRNQAAFNYGVLLLDANKPTEAIAAFRNYLAYEPDDNGGKNGIARAFRAAGMADSAKVYESQLTAAATAAGGSADITEADLFDIGVKQLTDKDYKAAAETFGKIVAMNPLNRDALYNEASAFYNLQDGANLSTAAEKLIGIDPLNESVNAMRVQGAQMTKNQDATLKAYTAMAANPVAVKVEGLAVGGSSATVTATATGREPTDEAGKPIAPRAITLAFEFLGKDGAVLATADAAVPALKKGETHPISVVGSAPGIVGWRYKVK